MKLVVKIDDGTQMVLEAERSDTVLSVKDKIPDVEVLLRKEEEILSTLWSSKAWGFFKIGKDLLFKGQLLEDFHVLADYEIEDNDTMDLSIPLLIGHIASTALYENPKKPEFITVFVDLPNGKRMTFEVDRTLPPSFILEQIPDFELIPTARQILKPMIPEMKTGVKIKVYFRTSLSLDVQALSGDTLEECNIKNNDVLKVYVHVSWEEDQTERLLHDQRLRDYQRNQQTTAIYPQPANETSMASKRYQRDRQPTAVHPQPPNETSMTSKRKSCYRCSVM